MAKRLQFNTRAQCSMKRGVETLAHAVRITLGPKGHNVVLDQRFEAPNILNDGVTIARGIDLEEPFTNMIVQLLKEAAIKTNDMAGDGTTTATVLVQAIFAEGLKNMVAGANPMMLRNGLERGSEALVEELKAISKPIETHEEIAQVATIAADAEIGETIAEVFDHVGRDGIILSNVPILITDKKITSFIELLPLLERLIAKGQKELVVVAEDIEGEALTTLIVNKTRSAFHVLGVRAPSFGDRREAALEDIAIMTGGQVISEKAGRRLENATLDDLGHVRSVTTTKDATLFVDGGGSKEAIQARIRDLRVQLADGTSDYDDEKLQQRLANLSGGVGVIKVGATTEVEMKEKTLRMQDALAATQAALEEGIVPGGGSALLIAQPTLDSVKTKMPDERTGVTILRRALEEPLRQIAKNSGYDGGVVVASVRDKPFGYGFDALSGQYVDMLEAGIVDPLKVTRTALQIAVSIAGLLLTTNTLITDAPVHIPDFKDIEFGL